MITNTFQKKLVYFLLFTIVLLGFFVRLYNLGAIPTGFFCDEASIGYNAYSILTTGKDEYATPFPLFFQAFGEYKSPIQIYSTVPFILIFGLNEFATRLPSALYGTATIVAIYFLCIQLFKRQKYHILIGLFSALFLAVSPWAIHFSRVSLEGLMAFVFFSTSAVAVFLRAQEKPKLLPAAILLFSLALYSYFPARIFVPAFGFCLFALYFKFFRSHIPITIISTILLILLLIPFIQNSLSSQGIARWQQVNIFSHPPQNESVLQHIAFNYLEHFSLGFLFLKGDIDMPGQFITRHSVRGIGELYLLQLPFIILGFITLLQKKIKSFFLLVVWLLLYPVGSMFTMDNTPQATRSIIGIIPFQILTGVGIVSLIQKLKRFPKISQILFFMTLFVLLIVSFGYYLLLYFTSYQNYSSDFWGWQYGPNKIVKYFSAHEKDYDELYMSPDFNAPYIFFKFYAPQSCTKCKLGTPDTTYNPTLKQIFAVTPDYVKNRSLHVITIKNIYYPNNTVAFMLVQIVQ